MLVPTIPAQFENGREFDGKKSLQDFDAKEKYLHPNNQSVSIKKCRKMFCFHHLRVFTRCLFQNVSVGVEFRFQKLPFSRFIGKFVRFRVSGRPMRHIFRRF